MNANLQRPLKPQPSVGSGLGLVAGAFVLFSLSCLALAGTLFWKQYSITSSWPEIDAQVMRSDVVQIHLGSQTTQ